MKIAIVHDFLREYGGAERVLESLHELYPQAPVYVAFYDQKALGIHWQRFADWDLRTTWFAKIPGHKKLYSPLRFLAPAAFKALDLSEFDVVISSSNAFEAKAVQAPNGVHICYCHTPPRALYGYSTMSSWKRNPIFRFFGELINHYMRMADFHAAQQVDVLVANSHETERRIEKFYRRQSHVIYPPVRVPSEKPATEFGQYYFFVSRLGLQKHPEMAVEAANRLRRPLKLAGAGPMFEYLETNAGSTVELLGPVSDDELAELYRHARALIFPVEDEDFGITPVEAMGYGVPVVAHRSGGPMETVIPGKTGVLFDELSTEGVMAGIKGLELLLEKKALSRAEIAKWAAKFSKENFQKQIIALVSQASKSPKPRR